MSSPIRCGTAGWSYQHWNGVIYPRPKPRGFHELEFLAQSFDSIEINTSFYQPLRPEISRLWLQKVSHNPNFKFTAKLNRRFTHERSLDSAEVSNFREGLLPLWNAGRLGCVLMQFPWSFRYTTGNREFFIELRRTFGEFPLVAEMRHSSWMREEALGTMIDYRVGFCNIDQPQHEKAMPPTSFLTSPLGYVRLHGRNHRNWFQDFESDALRIRSYDYLYSPAELQDWKTRIERLQAHAASIFVIFGNDPGGKAVINALQLQGMMGGPSRPASKPLLHQADLFHGRAVA